MKYLSCACLLLALMSCLVGCKGPGPEPLNAPPVPPAENLAPSADIPSPEADNLAAPGNEEAAPGEAENATEASAAKDGLGPKLEGEEGKKAVKTDSGLKYIVLEEGKGNKPAKGQTVVAEYTGWLTDGTKFDSSKGQPGGFSFAVGEGQVIPAWDEALLGMKVGERRKLIVPPELGYGAQGTPGGPIPPNATLIFEVKLVSVK